MFIVNDINEFILCVCAQIPNKNRNKLNELRERFFGFVLKNLRALKMKFLSIFNAFAYFELLDNRAKAGERGGSGNRFIHRERKVVFKMIFTNVILFQLLISQYTDCSQ